MEPEITLDDWIDTGTVARRTVTIYNDRALAAEYEALEAQLKDVQDEAEERSLDDEDPASEIMARMEELYTRWEASKAVWTVRALSRDEASEIVDRIPVPDGPGKLADTATAAEKSAHNAALKSWLRQSQRAQDERNLEFISTAIISVETAKGTARHASVDTLRRMRSRPHGAHDIERLVAAVNEATQGEVEISRPILPAS